MKKRFLHDVSEHIAKGIQYFKTHLCKMLPGLDEPVSPAQHISMMCINPDNRLIAGLCCNAPEGIVRVSDAVIPSTFSNVHCGRSVMSSGMRICPSTRVSPRFHIVASAVHCEKAWRGPKDAKPAPSSTSARLEAY